MEGTCEGDICNRDGCGGVLGYPPVQGCSCHINPPCSACVDNPLTCPVCGWEAEPPPIEPPTPNYSLLPWPLSEKRPLDPTKIDWHDIGHTNFTMIKRGVYPKGVTMVQVLDKIGRGTFGGRFNHFGNGKFEYVAYTD